APCCWRGGRSCSRCREPRDVATPGRMRSNPPQESTPMTSILDRFPLDGQVALVTGSGRGLRAPGALAFPDPGAPLVVSARSVAQIEETAAAVRARGRRALAVPCDVLEAAQRKHLVDAALDEFGRLDVLVNNAGGWPPKPTLETSEKEFEACFRFNVTTAFEM